MPIVDRLIDTTSISFIPCG